MQRHLLILAAILAAAPASAQSPPATGTLQQPARPPPADSKPTPATSPPATAPRSPVQQAPPTSALGHSSPGKPPPVVQAPANTHAQKPPTPAKPAARPPAVAAAPAAAPPVVTPPAAPEPPPAPTIGSATGQPLPRWASFRSDEVNLRAGPGTRYPIDWVYRRVGLPIQIEREFEAWRLITDQDGIKGWVHSATLVGRRRFAVQGKDRTLRKTAADDAAPVAILRPGVIGQLRACDAGSAWCEVQTADYRGWLRRDELWGILPGEIVK